MLITAAPTVPLCPSIPNEERPKGIDVKDDSW
jgi:hypothetical protein